MIALCERSRECIQLFRFQPKGLQQCYCSQYYFKFRLGEERLHKQIAVLSEKEPALEADSRRRESGHRRVLQGDESAQDQEVVFSTFISYVSNFISKII